MRKRIRNTISGFSTAIYGAANSAAQSLRKSTRFDARMRLANRWALKHKKATVALFFAMMSVSVIIAALYLCFKPAPKPFNDAMHFVTTQMAMAENREVLNEKARQVRIEIYESAIATATQLDSLLRLKHKTRRDSANIRALNKQYEFYKKIIDNEENQP